MAKGEPQLSEEALEDLEMGLEPIGEESVGEPNIQSGDNEVPYNFGNENLSDDGEVLDPSDPDHEKEGEAGGEKKGAAGGGQTEAVMTPEQYAENNWKKINSESEFRYDRETGKQYSVDGKICITDLIREKGNAELKGIHEQLLEGFRNNPQVAQMAERIEPIEGGYRINHTLIRIEGDGAIVSETWSKEFIVVQEVIDDDDSDVEQPIDDDDDEPEAKAPDTIDMPVRENDYSFSFFTQASEVASVGEASNASTIVEKDSVDTKNWLGLGIEIHPASVLTVETTMDDAALEDDDYSNETLEARASMHGSERMVLEKVVVEAPAKTAVDIREYVIPSSSVTTKEYPVYSERWSAPGIQKEFEVSTDEGSVDGIGIMELNLNDEGDEYDDEPATRPMVAELRGQPMGGQWIPIERGQIIEPLGIEIIYDDDKVVEVRAPEIIPVAATVESIQATVDEDDESEDDVGESDVIIEKQNKESVEESSGQDIQEVAVSVDDHTQTIEQSDRIVDQVIEAAEISKSDIVSPAIAELKGKIDEVPPGINIAETIEAKSDTQVKTFQEQAVLEHRELTSVETQEVVEAIQRQQPNVRVMEATMNHIDRPTNDEEISPIEIDRPDNTPFVNSTEQVISVLKQVESAVLPEQENRSETQPAIRVVKSEAPQQNERVVSLSQDMDESKPVMVIQESGEIKEVKEELETVESRSEQFLQDTLQENIQTKPSLRVVRGGETVADNKQRIDAIRSASRTSESLDRTASLRDSGIDIEEEEVTNVFPRAQRELERVA